MNSRLLAMVPAVVPSSAAALAQDEPIDTQAIRSLTVSKMTTNLYTDDVAACVRFWVDRLDFEKTMEVPEGRNLAFAAVKKGNLELMYGSYASLNKDALTAQAYQRGTSFLFLEVEDVNSVFAAMTGVPIVSSVHKTPYGATEFTVKDPAGHFITFAQFGKS
jgi:uncharacterized glyoxalase superfamily protein PhnB